MSDVSLFDLVWVGVLGALFFALARLARFAVRLVPLTPSQRDALRRALPALGALTVVAFCLLGATILFDANAPQFWVSVALIAGASVGASWFAVRDLVSGVVLKVGGLCRVGDHVRVGELHGRVERLGARVMVIETARGEQAIVPYSTIARDTMLRTPSAERGTIHVFELELPSDVSVPETKRRIRESALRCHWSAIARDPEITALDAGRYEVTVFALTTDRVRDVEEAVRAAVEG